MHDSSWLNTEIINTLYNLQWLGIFAAAFTCYTAYYFIIVVKKPRLICSEGKFMDCLQKNLAVLNEHYWPTFWCFSAHMMTICRVIFKAKPFIPYRREVLETPDGGLINLDWVDSDENNTLFPDPAKRPTVIIIPGLTGCSEASYCRHLVLVAREMGMRSLVSNNRGCGKNSFLKTPRTFCGNNTDDFKVVLKHLAMLFPESPVIGVGISLGGCIMTHHLAQVGSSQTQMIGAFIISVPWNCFSSTISLEQPLNWLLFNRHLTQKMLKMVKKNLNVFEQHLSSLPYELEHVMKAKSIREFDERFTSRAFGYRDHVEYYNAASLHSAPLENISVPTLFLNSADDPFSPGKSIPFDVVKKNPFLALLLTEYGGHIGFTEGFFIKDRTIVENTFMQLAKALGGTRNDSLDVNSN